MAPPVIRVLLADDHAIVREGLKQILARTEDLRVTGEARDAAEAIRMVREGAWDLLLTDLSMPGRSGLELLRQVHEEAPRLPVLVLSMHQEQQYAVRALRAGAAGYLNKDSAPEHLVTAIRRVVAGGRFISPEVAEALAADVAPGSGTAPHARLSDREFQVFLRIARGETVTAIAEALHLSVKTVSTHKTHVLEKLGAGNQAQLVRYALEHGLLDDAGSGERPAG